MTRAAGQTERAGARAIVLVLALALALRIVFFLLCHPWSYPLAQQLSNVDSPRYHQLACTLLDAHRLAATPTGPPDGLRTPGYPVFVAAIYAIAGRSPWIVFVAQIVLDVLTCALIFAATRRILGPTPARLAALFYAIDPNLVLHASLFLSETLFVFVLAIALLVFARARSAAGGGRALSFGLLGLVLGLATLVRPVGLYLTLAWGLFVLLAYVRRPRFAWGSCGLLLAGAAVVVVPWSARNLREFGRPELTYIDSWDLLGGDVAIMEAPRRHQDMQTTAGQLMVEADTMMVHDGADPWTIPPLRAAPYWRRLAFRYIRNDPVGFAKANLKGVVFGLGSVGSSSFAAALHLERRGVGAPIDMGKSIRDFGRKQGVERAIGIVTFGLLLVGYLCFVVGAITAWRRFDRVFLAFCLLTVIYFMLVPGAYGNSRLRLPAMPFLVGFMGLGLERIVAAAVRGRARGAPASSPAGPSSS